MGEIRNSIEGPANGPIFALRCLLGGGRIADQLPKLGFRFVESCLGVVITAILRLKNVTLRKVLRRALKSCGKMITLVRLDNVPL